MKRTYIPPSALSLWFLKKLLDSHSEIFRRFLIKKVSSFNHSKQPVEIQTDFMGSLKSEWCLLGRYNVYTNTGEDDHTFYLIRMTLPHLNTKVCLCGIMWNYIYVFPIILENDVTLYNVKVKRYHCILYHLPVTFNPS